MKIFWSWIVATSEQPPSPIAWLIVKLTAFLAVASLYGRTLARLALCATAVEPMVGLSMARQSCTRRRIEAVQRHVFRARLSRPRATWVVAAAALATVLLGGVGLGRSSAQSPPAVDSIAPGVVTGEVLDAQNEAPVAGAEVLLRDTRLLRARTDDKGRFRFEHVPDGQYRVWAFKEGLASPKERLVGRESPPSGGVQFAPIRLRMSPGKQVKPTVTSAETGRPVEGAEVRLGNPDRRQATTDKEGVALLRALLPEEYEVTVLAAGHAREERQIDLAGSAQETSLSFSLPSGGVLHGKVTDEDEHPLAGVYVDYRNAGMPDGYSGEPPQSDEQGSYRNPYLPLETPIEVSVDMPAYLPWTMVVTLSDRQREYSLDISLKRRPRGGSVAGIVADREGRPIEGATVGNYGNRSDEKRETTTDAQGRFVLHDLLKTYVGYEVVVRARGLAPTLRKVEPGPAETPSDASVRLEPGHFLHGRVENAAGEPIKGARVSIANGPGPFQALEFIRTDDQGRFDFDTLAVGNKFQISSQGYSSRADVSLPLDGDAIVPVKLEPMGVLRGRVVDASTGQAIQQFRVRSSLGDTGRTFQAADGTFTLNALTNHLALDVTVEAEGYQRSVLPRVVVQPVSDAAVVGVALKKSDPTRLARLSGTLLDHRKSPLAGVQLRLIVSPSAATGDDDNRFNWVLIDIGQLGRKSYVAQYLSTVSDAQGRFEFRDVLPGMYLQLAYWGRNAPKSRSLAFAKTKAGVAQTVTIAVPEPARITGSFDARVFPDSGEVQLSRKDNPLHSYSSALAVGQAEFRFENLPPGDYWLSIMHQPERHKDNPQMISLRPLASRSLTVEPGGAYKVQFTENDRVDRQGH